jgi:hypothetical protein
MTISRAEATAKCREILGESFDLVYDNAPSESPIMRVLLHPNNCVTLDEFNALATFFGTTKINIDHSFEADFSDLTPGNGSESIIWVYGVRLTDDPLDSAKGGT